MTRFDVYDWFLEILKELQKHAAEDQCCSCEKLISNMANEVRTLKKGSSKEAKQ